jgi:uncharacterized membrane protein
MRPILAALLAIAWLPWVRAATAQPGASFSGLGFPVGFATSEAVDVSADGSIVLGKSSGVPFLWTAATGPLRIDALPAGTRVLGISDAGAFVVGSVDATSSLGRPMRWSQATGIERLGDLPDPDPSAGDYSAAEAASADGSVVVGASSDQAFRWTAESGTVALGGWYDRPFSYGRATDVSADGSVVVGYAPSPFGGTRVFRWTQADGMQPLDAFGSLTIGPVVSADGAVVAGVGFRWSASDGLLKLGSLPGTYEPYIRDLSGDGSILVGVAGGVVGLPRAVFWHASIGLRELGALLADEYGLRTGWTLLEANGISTDGRTIVGTGLHPDGEAWRVTLALRCLDGVDDDGDGAIDFPDEPGCAAPLDDSESTDCDNGEDDDGDGRADMSDPGCTDALDGSEVVATSACDDHVDDDRDGLVDFPADPGCTAPDDATELGECQNGIDDDADGLVDLDDSGCESAIDPAEFLATECGNGTDDDGDGRVDADDPGCPSPLASPEDPPCDNRIDDDGDGAVDFADSGCTAAWPYWEGVPCGLGVELGLALPVLALLRRRTAPACAWRARRALRGDAPKLLAEVDQLSR